MSKHKEIYMKGEGNHQYGLKGSLNDSWKSDTKITRYGYRSVRCLNHPFVDKTGFVLEHRLVAEKYLLNDKNSINIDGKLYLSENFHIHHINFNRLDNNVDNLYVLPKGIHIKFHDSLYDLIRNDFGRIIKHIPKYDLSNSILMRDLFYKFMENK